MNTYNINSRQMALVIGCTLMRVVFVPGMGSQVDGMIGS